MKLLRPIILSLFVTPVAGQWEHTGPYGAWTSCHVHLNGTDLVGGTAGIFKSTDGGETWAPWGNGLPSETVMELHAFNGVLYAGIDQEGLFRSLDDGLTWEPCNNAAMGNPYEITGLSNDGTDLLVSCDQGRFRCSDQGLDPIALGNTANYPGVMIALGGGVIITHGGFNYPGNVYRSTDNGASWQLANTGFEATPEIGAIHPDGSDLYAFGKHVYRSTDQGLTWTQVTTTPLPYSPQHTCRIGDRFYLSNDGNVNVIVSRWDLGSTTFVNIAPGLPDTWTTVIFGNAAGDVFINKGRSLHRSLDHGATWEEQSATGMIGAETYSLLVEEDLVICGSHEGIHRSTDAGSTWQRVASLEYTYVSALHKIGNTVLAATSNGLQRSGDNGLTWTTGPLMNLTLGSFSDGGGSLFVGGNNAGNAAVRRSTDGGTTWSDFSSGLPGQAGVLDVLVTGTTVFAGIGAGPDGEPGVYRSGISSPGWTLVNSGIEGLAGTAFVMNQGALYVGTENGVHRSTDLGNSWEAVGSALAGMLVHDLIVVGNNVVAATEDGIHLLPPGASDWNDITDDLLPTEPMALSTGIGNAYLYVATQGRSVARRPLGTVGTQEVAAQPTLHISPNPATAELRITGGPRGVWSVAIRDLTGRVVSTRTMMGTQALDVRELPAGVYTLSIAGQSAGQSVRFIKH